MIDALRQNIESELRMILEISNYAQQLPHAEPAEQKIVIQTIESLRGAMKIVNANIPKILGSVTITQKLPSPAARPQTPFKEVRFHSSEGEVAVTLEERDRDRFLRELSISEQLMSRMKKRPSLNKVEPHEEFQSPRGYLKLSNKFFLTTALELLRKGYFQVLSVEFRKANLNILFATYIAMMLFTTLL